MKYVAIETCQDMIVGEVRTRGLMLGFIAGALRKKYGDEALAAMRTALSQAGRVSGQSTAKALAKNDLSAVESIIGDPVWQRILKPKVVEKTRNRIVIDWCSCPVPSLDEAFGSEWSPTELLENACVLLETYDKAFFEGINPKFVVRGPHDTGNMGLVRGCGYCTLEISLTKS